MDHVPGMGRGMLHPAAGRALFAPRSPGAFHSSLSRPHPAEQGDPASLGIGAQRSACLVDLQCGAAVLVNTSAARVAITARDVITAAGSHQITYQPPSKPP